MLALAGGIALLLPCAAAPARAQDSAETTQAAQKQEADWTVVEYPEGRETVVELKPTAYLPDARGTARVTRSGDGVAITLDVSGLGSGEGNYHLYAVSHEGRVVPLGSVPTTDGTGSLSANTDLSRFMLVLLPVGGLTAVDAATPVALRSAVPEGLAVVPRAGGASAEAATPNDEAAPEESASAAAAPDDAAGAGARTEYEVPLLDIGSFRRGAETRLTSQSTGDLSGTSTAVFIKPLKGGATQVKVRFNNLPEPANGARYVLWAVSPDKTYTRLGQVERPDKKRAARIDARTTLRDFGLFITAESDVAADAPSGPTVAMVVR
jgi:hypothetical protein